MAVKFPRYLITRDVLLLAATGAAWMLDARVRADGGALALGVGVVAGVLTAVSGFLAHEYGHLSASLATGSAVSYPSSPWSTLLFHFDSAQNDRRQFFWMSMGGYLATAVAVGAIAVSVPLDAWSGRVALGLAGLGMIVTFALEVPITVRVMRGAPLPMAAAYRPYE